MFSCFSSEVVWKENESRRAIKRCWMTPCCAFQVCTRRTALTSMSPARCLQRENLLLCPSAPHTKPSAHGGSKDPLCFLFFFLYMCSYLVLVYYESTSIAFSHMMITFHLNLGFMFNTAGMSGCGCRWSTPTFRRAPRSLSLCGTSMGLAEPFLSGGQQSPCLENMGGYFQTLL